MKPGCMKWDNSMNITNDNRNYVMLHYGCFDTNYQMSVIDPRLIMRKPKYSKALNYILTHATCKVIDTGDRWKPLALAEYATESLPYE